MSAQRVNRVFVAAGMLIVGAIAGSCSSDGSEAGDPVSIQGTMTVSYDAMACDSSVGEVQLIIKGSGDLTGLGPTTVHIEETATCEPGRLIAITTIEGVYTTENGDELRFSGTGSAIAFENNVATYAADDQFTGGTGRFAHATGQETVSATHSFTTDVFTLDIDGDVAL